MMLNKITMVPNKRVFNIGLYCMGFVVFIDEIYLGSDLDDPYNYIIINRVRYKFPEVIKVFGQLFYDTLEEYITFTYCT